MRPSACFKAKNSDFSKLMVCLHGQVKRGRVGPVRTFFGHWGGRSTIRDFVGTSFKDGPLCKSWKFCAVELL